MPGRDRRLRELQQELLSSLLGDEAPGGDSLPQDELAALLLELRRGRRRRPTALGGLLSSEQLRGFVLGLGVATLLLMVLPTAKKSLRPFALIAVKGALDLADQVKALVGEAGEGLQDLIAEAQFERLQKAAGPEGASQKEGV